MRKTIFLTACSLLLLSGCSVESVPGLNINEHAPVQAEAPETAAIQAESVEGKVIEVTDGDTFKVQLSTDLLIRGLQLSKGQTIVVRALLIDTPESVGERAGMPLGEEASSFAKDLLEGKMVTLEFDQGELQDHYDRFLAYAYVDGQRVQNALVEEGYAMIRYINEPNTRYLEELRAVEAEARSKEIGIWGISDYVQIEKRFNEAASSDLVTELKNTGKQAAEDIATELIDEVFDSLLKK